MAERLQKSFPAYVTKAEGDAGIVGAFTSIFGNIDYGYDVIVAGAFAKTISERKAKIRVLDNHNSWSAKDAIGKILDIYEVGRDGLPLEVQTNYPDATGGLYVEIQFMLEDELSNAVFQRIKMGVIDEYSIGFEIIQQEIRTVPTDGGEERIRFIKEIKLYEVSPVIFAMNDATATVTAKNKDAAAEDTPELENKADMPMQPAMGDDMCRNCIFYGAVTEELGYCKMHEMATAAALVCDDYKTAQKNLVRDRMRVSFANFLQAEIAAYRELGAWTEDDEEKLNAMLEALSDAFLLMLPKDMADREIPTPAEMTLPKSLSSDIEAEKGNAEPLNALTLALQAEILESQIKARM